MEADILLHAILAPLLLAAALLCAPWVARLVLGGSSRRMGARGLSTGALAQPRLAITPLALVPLAAFAHQQELSGPSAWVATIARPSTAFDRFPLAVLAAAIVAVAMDRVARAGGALGALSIGAVAATASCVVLQPPGHGSAEWRLAAAVVVAIAAAGSIASAGCTTRATFVAWWGTLAAASGACLLAGFAKLAVVMGAASAAAALGAVTCGAMPWVRADGGMGALFAVILGAGAFLGIGYDERGLPPACWAAIALAPATSLLANAVHGRPRLATVLRAGLPIAVSAAAVAVAASLTASAGPEASGY